MHGEQTISEFKCFYFILCKAGTLWDVLQYFFFFRSKAYHPLKVEIDFSRLKQIQPDV